VEHDGGSGGKRPAADDNCSIFAIFFLFLFSRAGDVSTRKQKTNFRVRVCHPHEKIGFSQTLWGRRAEVRTRKSVLPIWKDRFLVVVGFGRRYVV
jgi:hypothetical protein